MSIIESLSTVFGKRPSDHPPAPGYEHFGGEPTDPRNSRYWRSIPHPSRIPIPTMADYLIEVVSRVRAHTPGVDDATGPFLFHLIETEAEATGVAIEERHVDQVRTEQGLWADEDTAAYRQQRKAQILRTQLGIADADYRAGRDALLGEPGATPAWDQALIGERRTPSLPVPDSAVVAPAATDSSTTKVSGPDPHPVAPENIKPAPGSDDTTKDDASKIGPVDVPGELTGKAA